MIFDKCSQVVYIVDLNDIEMNVKLSLVFVVYLVVQFQSIDSARILGFFSTPSRSHLIIHESLMRELAIRGHDVSVHYDLIFN